MNIYFITIKLWARWALRKKKMLNIYLLPIILKSTNKLLTATIQRFKDHSNFIVIMVNYINKLH